MFLITVSLDLTLIDAGVIDPSKHSMSLKVDASLLAKCCKDVQYIKFQNASLRQTGVALSDFAITPRHGQQDHIPVYTIQDHSEELAPNIVTFKMYLQIVPKSGLVTLHTSRDIIKFKTSKVQKIKMGFNNKLKQLISGVIQEKEYGFLSMDRRKRLTVNDINLTDPVVGLWIAGQDISIHSLFVYDLLHKYITSPFERKCRIVNQKEDEPLSFILQVYRGSKPQTYLLAVQECSPQKTAQTLCYHGTRTLEFGSEQVSSMEFTLRDRTMHTLDLYSPIKGLHGENQDRTYNSPEFTRIEGGGELVQRLKTQQGQIQDLKVELQMVRSELRRTQDKTPEKSSFIRSPCYNFSSIRKTTFSDKLKESDLKVFTNYKQRSKQSTSVKSTREVEEFEKVRDFLLGNGVPGEFTAPTHLHNQIWDNLNIHIIQEQS